MAYQSASSRPAAQESYGADNDAHSSSNIGLSNSARGEGTSLPEMVAKLRFFNCTVCAYIILFHILPIVLNPIKLALVLKSPIRLILEIIVAMLSVFLFTTESRMPIFAEKLLHFLFRKCRLPISTGGNRGMQLLDLDVARGRVICITVMTLCIGMVNHLNSKPHSGTGTTASSNSVDNVVDNDVQESMINGTNSSSPAAVELFNETAATAVTAEAATGDIQDENNNNTAILGFLSAIFYSTVFSVTMWFLLTLLVYNLYVMKEYPSYAEYRAFPHVQQQDDEALSPTAANSSRRSWVSNITDFSSIRSAVGSVGGGYQSVDNPIQMNV